MSRRMALLVSAALTAFVLIGAIGVSARLGVAGWQGTTEPPAAASSASPPADQQLLYQQLTALQAENASLRQQVAGEGSRPTGSTPGAAAGVALSPEQAGRVAAQALGGGTARSVKLERGGGRAVYEVKVGRDEVYVDAATAQVFAGRGGEHEDDDD